MPPHEIVTPERPQRADARRNRERVLESARASFAAAGLDTQMDDVARHAGVGVGTVYRHFPTKEALVHALVERKFATIADEARRARAEEDDPWEAFRRTLWRGGELHAADRVLAQVWSTQPNEIFASAAERSGLRALMGEMLAEAQAAGAVRADAVVDDVPMVMCALGSVLEAAEQGMPGTWERFLTLALDGLRARDGAPLPP